MGETMLVFDAEQQESIKDGVWCDYEGGIKTRIRPFDPATQRRLRKEASKGGRMDQDLYNRLFWDHLIADWNVPEAIKKDGQVVGTRPLACTPENKLLVTGAWSVYSNWVTRTADRLGEDAAEVEVTRLGNSEAGPGGKATGPANRTAPASPAPPATTSATSA